MRKFIGISLIILGLFLGLIPVILSDESLIFSIITLFLFCLPLYMAGQLLRTSLEEFQENGMFWMNLYLFFYVVVPITFKSFDLYNLYKREIVKADQYITIQVASRNLFDLSLILFLALLGLLMSRMLSPIKRKKLLNLVIIGVISLLVGFNYILLNDYQGVHPEHGLVSNTWKTEKEIIPFEKISGIYVEPYIHYGRLSDTSDETRFMWNIIFSYTNQTDEYQVYVFRRITKENLKETTQIKDLAKKQDIPFTVGEMNDDEILKWFDFDLELERLDKEKYYELFEVDY